MSAAWHPPRDTTPRLRLNRNTLFQPRAAVDS
jgi:hypothetical protein